MAPIIVLSLMGLFGTTGHFSLIAVFKYAPAVLLSRFMYSQMLYSMLSSTVLLGDALSPVTFFGALLLVVSGVYIWWRERKLGVPIPSHPPRPDLSHKSRPQTSEWMVLSSSGNERIHPREHMFTHRLAGSLGTPDIASVVARYLGDGLGVLRRCVSHGRARQLLPVAHGKSFRSDDGYAGEKAFDDQTGTFVPVK